MSSSASPARRQSTISTASVVTEKQQTYDHQQQQPQSVRQSQIIQQQPGSGLRLPSNRKTIYDRHLNRSRTADLSRAAFAFLFAEMVTYAQRRVTGIQDLERRYSYPTSVIWTIIAPPLFPPFSDT